MNKERNKNYQLRDLAIGDRFTFLANSKTVYEIISFKKSKRFNQEDHIDRVMIKNSESKKESGKDPSLIVTFLRSV